jgi:hypothetical protein
MPDTYVWRTARVRCIGPEHHLFTTKEDVKHKAHYVADQDAPIGCTIPQGSLVKVRCPACNHQVEEVTNAQGFTVLGC